jgi:hypothetical protein
MDPFRLINEASLEDVRGSQPRAGADQTGVPFLMQVERVLGEETVPDSEFFIDSWTVGVAAASENLLHRQENRKNREHETPEWVAFPFFAPRFVAGEESSVEAAWLLREARADEASMTYRRWQGDEEADDWQTADELEMAGPLTLESACRVLGVAATSTREQIRAAYRKMASRYHPDRLARSGAREQKLASDRMAWVNEAYRLLCTGLAGRWRASSVR